MATEVRQPDGDVDAGLWVTVPLWSKINEGSGSPDGTYIICPDNKNSAGECSTQNPSNAGTYTAVEIKAYTRKSAAGANQRGLDGDIRVNGNLQGQKVFQADLTENWVEYSQTWVGLNFTQAEMDSLQVLFISTGTIGGSPGNRREVWLDYYEIILTYTPGGVALEKDLFDTLSLGDAVGKGFGATRMETLGLADALGKGSEMAKVEAFTLTDIIGKGAEIGKADSLLLSESPATEVAFERSQLDNIALLEGLAKSSELERDDVVGLVDSIGKDTDVIRIEILGLTDSIAKRTEAIKVESLALSESLAREATFERSPSDSLILAEAQLKSNEINKVDAVTIADILNKGVEVSKGETLGVSDSPTLGSQIFKSDVVALAEAIMREASFERTPSDSLVLADSIMTEGGGQVASFYGGGFSGANRFLRRSTL